MTPFDLLFILVFLITVVSLTRGVYLAVRKRAADAKRVFLILSGSVVLYLGIVIVVSAITPRRVLSMHQDECFDDWCLAVEGVTKLKTIGAGAGAASARGAFYVVEIRVSSRAKRVRQRETHAEVYLLDSAGNTYDPSPEGQLAVEKANGPTKPLSSYLDPGTAFRTVRVFDLPRDARDIGLVKRGGFPGWFIISDGSSLFHKRTMIQLSAGR